MIFPISIKEASVIASLHKSSLSEDFLPSLGIDFLETFYLGVVGKPGVFGFINKDNGIIDGFVVGTDDMNRFFRTALISKFIPLLFCLGIQFIKKPSIVKNVFETFFYSSREKGPKAELVVIAVDKASRGKGIGKKLVYALETEMKKRKIKEYKLTVTHRNEDANVFYNALGFTDLSNFVLYDKSWNILVKKI